MNKWINQERNKEGKKETNKQKKKERKKIISLFAIISTVTSDPKTFFLNTFIS